MNWTWQAIWKTACLEFWYVRRKTTCFYSKSWDVCSRTVQLLFSDHLNRTDVVNRYDANMMSMVLSPQETQWRWRVDGFLGRNDPRVSYRILELGFVQGEFFQHAFLTMSSNVVLLDRKILVDFGQNSSNHLMSMLWILLKQPLKTSLVHFHHISTGY